LAMVFLFDNGFKTHRRTPGEHFLHGPTYDFSHLLGDEPRGRGIATEN
jgi:hypothetical protein